MQIASADRQNFKTKMSAPLKVLKPKLALNKAFLKVSPLRSEIEVFKANLIKLIDQTNDFESEEFHKNLVSDFLKDTYYKQNHFINTKGRNDLVIHNGTDAKSSVGVIIEAKKPTNKSEMMTTGKLNTKAFQELVLYYLRERITHKNLEVRHLIVSNINEWFIFDAQLFDRLFAQNKNLVNQFVEFEEGRLADTKTDFFYKQIAEPFIKEIDTEITFAYFNLKDYQKALRNDDLADDGRLVELYKLLSPEHLLKLPFANDSNSLDKGFYTELLHIIGLKEIKEGSKKIIDRNKESERSSGTLIEDTIIQLDSLDKIGRLDHPEHFGTTQEERLFNVALQLSITWINRILFLKLLEAQLISYHKGDKSYAFLSLDKIKNYDDLNSLFFQVLARKYDERNKDVKTLFDKVPYLNSSLFEPTELEHATLFISNLKEDKSVAILSQTVLKDQQGKKRAGNLSALDYLFDFLNAYNFSSEGTGGIREDNKTLINASVLGLIFEKINGYKDGSFFTPGFITMYMCRETIRKAVVQKFNETKKWNCKNLDDLYDKIEDRKEANEIVNSVKICDPAVGSGHFLVSALNEMIAVKHDLKILVDRSGKRIKEYSVEVVNDELAINDEDGEPFEYNPSNKESQRIQEMLFHEKQTIIENCLFGVDINPNSVKICRLRLWIELLKNAYYKNETELETLPNIDINIKCGNSLISRFAIDADLGEALKKSKWNIGSYRLAVETYRNAKTKDQKREMEKLIRMIKSDFRTEIGKNDPKVKRLEKLEIELVQKFKIVKLDFDTETNKELKSKEKANRKKVEDEISVLKVQIEQIKSNKIFENAFEWRFEFPEVLDDKGDFIGFDVVIGNPPYGVKFTEVEKVYLKDKFKSIIGKYDSYGFFIELGIEILGSNKNLGFIIPHTWTTVVEAQSLRNLLVANTIIEEIDVFTSDVFEDANVETTNLLLHKSKNIPPDHHVIVKFIDNKRMINELTALITKEFDHLYMDWVERGIFNLQLDSFIDKLHNKVIGKSEKLEKYFDLTVGIQAYDTYSGQSKETISNRIYHSNRKINDTYRKELNGKDVNRYSLTSKTESWLSYGEWLAHPRNKTFFEGPKVLVREITTHKPYPIVATYDDTNHVYYKSILGIKSKDHLNEEFNCKYLLGILNSRLIGYYFMTNSNKTVTKTFPRVSLIDIKKFPIKIESSLLSKKVVELVNRVIQIKKLNQLENTFDLEQQIDRLVYELYDLTKEEIKIIEESVK